MTSSETYFLDTNILVYAADDTSPFYQASVAMRDKGMQGEISVCITPQVLSEFFSVITDPKRTKRPRSQKEAVAEVEKYIRAKNIRKIFAPTDSLTSMLDFLTRYPVIKQEVFDLQLVVTMLSNGVSRIFTYDRDGFAKYDEIEVLSPESILQ